MKWLIAALLIVGLALIVFGAPWANPEVWRETRFNGPDRTLPMTFRHNDHFTVSCAICHHEFVDGTTGPSCMSCHVTDATVAPLLEEQFHTLCRDCHVAEHAKGAPAGPTRACVGCHIPDEDF